MVEILPDPVLGWFLLEKSGLDALERSVIQGEIKGQFSLKSVENALRSHWSDDQLRKRDGDIRHDAQFQDDGEDEDEPEETDFENMAQWTEDEKAWFQDAKAEEHQAWMQLQQARRTLREARTRQHDIKMSRRFYKPGTSPNPGKTTFRHGAGPGAAGGKPLGKIGPCFNCGSFEHRVANCPRKKKESAQMIDGDEENLAEFTYFQDTKDTFPEVDGELTSAALFQGGHQPVSTEEAIAQGKAVIDGGATKTMGSLHALESLTQANQQTAQDHGVCKVDTDDRPVFGFGNSQKSRCMSTCTMKIPCETQPVRMKIHVLEQGRAPILLSVESLRRMGAIIDYSNDLAVFRHLNDRVVVPLERSQAGHQLLPLASDFLREGFSVDQPVQSLKQLVE